MTEPVVPVVVVGAEVVGAELDEVLVALVEGGTAVLGEPPPGPEAPGDPPAPVVEGVLKGLVVVEEFAPVVGVPVGCDPDGAPPGVELTKLVGGVSLGEVVSGLVVDEVVPGLVPEGEPGLVGIPMGELPPELPGTVPKDEVLRGLDSPLGELVLGPVLGELRGRAPPGELPPGELPPGELPPRPPRLVGDVPLGLVRR